MRWLILVVLAGCDGAASGGTVKIDDGTKAQLAALTATMDALTDRIEALEAAAVNATPIGGPPESGTVIATFTGAECTGDKMLVVWPATGADSFDPADAPIVGVSHAIVGGSELPKTASFDIVSSWTCDLGGVCGYTVPCTDSRPDSVYQIIAL